jgi:hypothetical protein
VDRDEKKKSTQKSNASKIGVLVVEGYLFMTGLVSQVLCGLGAKEADLAPNGAEAVQRLNH